LAAHGGSVSRWALPDTSTSIASPAEPRASHFAAKQFGDWLASADESVLHSSTAVDKDEENRFGTLVDQHLARNLPSFAGIAIDAVLVRRSVSGVLPVWRPKGASHLFFGLAYGDCAKSRIALRIGNVQRATADKAAREYNYDG